MTIHVIQGRGYDSNIFLIGGKEPTIIDTGTGLNKEHVHKEIQSHIDPEHITRIILTHEHYDHTGGSKDILELTGNNAQIFSHPYTKEKVEEGKSMFASMLGGTMPKISVDKSLNGGDQLIIGDNTYEVIHTPGHTPGCICLYDKNTKTLFSGDTVFSHGSFGRTDFPGGNLSQLQHSIKTLSQLDITHLYPGHESIIEVEAKNHIALSYQNVCSLR